MNAYEYNARINNKEIEFYLSSIEKVDKIESLSDGKNYLIGNRVYYSFNGFNKYIAIHFYCLYELNEIEIKKIIQYLSTILIKRKDFD